MGSKKEREKGKKTTTLRSHRNRGRRRPQLVGQRGGTVRSVRDAGAPGMHAVALGACGCHGMRGGHVIAPTDG